MSESTPTARPSRCLTCWWWGFEDSESDQMVNRQCRRFPPVANRGADGDVEAHWPWTNQHDYCGEHKEDVIRRMKMERRAHG